MTEFQAVSPDGSRLYITGTESGVLAVVGGARQRVFATIEVGPGSVAVSPDGTRVLVSGAAAGTVSLIETATYTAVATVEVGDGPAFVVVAPAAALPTSKEQCKKGRRRGFWTAFKNGGGCVSFVARR